MSDKTNVAAKAPADALKGGRKITLREFLLNYNAIIILVVLLIVASLISDIKVIAGVGLHMERQNGIVSGSRILSG